MNILFLGDIVGNSGCGAVKKFLPDIIKSKKINFVIVNGENAAKEGVGITENIVNELLSCGVDVITTGNHAWDQKETSEFIKKQKSMDWCRSSGNHIRLGSLVRATCSGGSSVIGRGNMFLTIAFIIGFVAGWYVNEKFEDLGAMTKKLMWWKK